MIIFGTRGREETIDHGRFLCPRCRDMRGYAMKQVRRWFTLYFIPVFPIDGGTKYVECELCRTTFKPEVLQLMLQAVAEAAAPVAWLSDGELRRALARAMGVVLQRTGAASAATQVAWAAKVFKNATGAVLPETAFRQDLADIAAKTLDVPAYLAGIAPNYPDDVRQRLFGEILTLAKAVGVTTSSGDATIGGLAEAFRIAPADVDALAAKVAA